MYVVYTKRVNLNRTPPLRYWGHVITWMPQYWIDPSSKCNVSVWMVPGTVDPRD